MTLSTTRAKALIDPGRYSDGGGLHLYISKAGGKSWVQRITIDGRRRDIGLGGFPSVSLARAREKAAENRAAVAEGRDPLADRHAPAMPTFREAAGAVHEANRPRWRNAKHIASWMQTLERLLLNNMAWALRRFPVFPVYGNGDYPVQPVYVEDLAAQAVEAASQSESSVADAAGPDTLSFEALLRLLASSMDVRRWFPHTPPRVGLALTGLVGLLMRDMALTRDEVVGLMDGLLTSGEPPTGTTRLSDWLAENGDGLGRPYVSELRRNYRG